MSVRATQHLTIEDLAAREAVSVATVHAWNRKGTGPRRMRIGRHVRYRLADVIAWEETLFRGGDLHVA